MGANALELAQEGFPATCFLPQSNLLVPQALMGQTPEPPAEAGAPNPPIQIP